jgi:hypothetical protein
VTLASALGFAAFVGLAAQHAVGSSKRHSASVVPARSAVASSTYFDERSAGFAFDDGPGDRPSSAGSSGSGTAGASGGSRASQPVPPTPAPVAQTSVS